jgi:hypothetical protein
LPILQANPILETAMKSFWQTVLPDLKEKKAMMFFFRPEPMSMDRK